MRALFSFMFSAITNSLVVLLIAMLSVNYIPDHLFNDFPMEPKSHESINYESVLPEPNTRLSDGKPEFIQLNNINGPESIAISKEGLLYTGLADGRLVEFDPARNYQMREVLRFKEGARCQDNVVTNADECGRFLGLKFVNDTLYAVEANSGLYMVDVKSGYKILLGPKTKDKISIFNSFVFDPKEPNLVYLTITSTRWSLLNFIWSCFELESSGKLLAMDIKSGKRVVVADNLLLPNGIDVDTKRDRIVFTETMRSSVSMIQLEGIRVVLNQAKDGEKLHSIEVKPLIPLVPGNPDNIVIDNDLAYIALPSVRTRGRELVDYLYSVPNVRKALARFTFGAGKLLEYINNFYNHPLLETAYRELKCGHVYYRLFKTDQSGVIEYNLVSGGSRYFGSNTYGFISEAVPDNKGNLYIGSFRSPFLVKQKL